MNSEPNKIPPKVLHYLGEYLPITMTWVYNQIQFNTRYQHMVATQRTENLKLFPTRPILSLENFTPKQRLYNRAMYRLVGYYPDFLKEFRPEKPTVIQAHFGHYGYKALGLKKQLNIPLVTFFYGYEMSSLAKKSSYKKRFKTLFKEGDRFLVIGNAMKNDVLKMGCPDEKVEILKLGVDADEYPFRERTFTAGQNIILLFAANFGEKKGLPYALKAFARAYQKHKNLRFRVIGDGPNRNEIKMLIRELNIDSAVELKGFVHYSKLIEEMLAADLFIQPSLTAKNGNTEGGYPVAVLDAQSTGLPILTTLHADNPECVVPEKSAKLSPEKEFEQLGDNLIYLIEHPQDWPAMGRIGREHVRQNYNAKTQGAALANLYDRLTK